MFYTLNKLSNSCVSNPYIRWNSFSFTVCDNYDKMIN